MRVMDIDVCVHCLVQGRETLLKSCFSNCHLIIKLIKKGEFKKQVKRDRRDVMYNKEQLSEAGMARVFI